MEQLKTDKGDRKTPRPPSPGMVALGAGALYTLCALPVAWALNGLVKLGVDRWLEKIPLNKDTWSRFKRIDPIDVTVVGTILGYGIYKEAKKAYDQAKAAEKQHDKLVADNIAMRGQLNQTGQILRHVADEVSKGKIADSQLTFDESSAPPTHVARLEAEKAAAAAQTALAKV